MTQPPIVPGPGQPAEYPPTHEAYPVPPAPPQVVYVQVPNPQVTSQAVTKGIMGAYTNFLLIGAIIVFAIALCCVGVVLLGGISNGGFGRP